MTLLVQERPTLTVAVTMSASVECYPGSQASPCWQAGRLRFHTWLLLSYGNILVINQDSLSVHVTLWLTLVQQTCAVILYLQNYCIANLSWFSHFISAKNQQFWPLIGGVMKIARKTIRHTLTGLAMARRGWANLLSIECRRNCNIITYINLMLACSQDISGRSGDIFPRLLYLPDVMVGFSPWAFALASPITSRTEETWKKLCLRFVDFISISLSLL